VFERAFVRRGSFYMKNRWRDGRLWFVVGPTVPGVVKYQMLTGAQQIDKGKLLR
jgi:hypothetical protein